MIITITTIVTILSIITIVMINSGYGRLWKSWTGEKPQLFSPIHGEKAASRKSEFPSLSPMSPLPSSPSSSILVIVLQHHLDQLIILHMRCPSGGMSTRCWASPATGLLETPPSMLLARRSLYFSILVFLYFGYRISWQDIFRINNHITAKLRQWFFSGDLASSSQLIGSSKLWRIFLYFFLKLEYFWIYCVLICWWAGLWGLWKWDLQHWRSPRGDIFKTIVYSNCFCCCLFSQKEQSLWNFENHGSVRVPRT